MGETTDESGAPGAPGETPERVAAIRRERDLELLSAYRYGDTTAGEKLYTLYYDDALIAAKDAVTDHATAEDFVAEAFAKIFELIDRGKGPTENFRYYLRATIRSIALNWYSEHNRTESIADFTLYEPQLAEQSGQDAEAHSGLEEGEDVEIVDAFQRLPERWRHIIFLRVVEQRSSAESAQALGLKAAAGVELYKRARDGLRKEYLSEIASARSGSGSAECQEFAPDLAKLSATGKLTRGKQRLLNAHMAGCETCSSTHLELDSLAQRFNKKTIAPALAGVAASVVLPGLSNGTRAAALAGLPTLAPWAWAGLAAGVIALAAIGGILIAGAAGRGDTGSQSDRITVQEGSGADGAGGATCTLDFKTVTSGAVLAKLVTTNTGGGTCEVRAWQGDTEVLEPFSVRDTQVTILTRPGQLRVELTLGTRSETKTFTIPKR
ncbi:sigma-70 family RNA polymerase sigma factor [Leucobacter insecticola]|uniref:Sigma-70 family RNA polymerase sigma factor n=1 Tax=Leucobacter insecticola TaxID=2714934 RepID=A0A6G8FHS1_9MICO|nr:sigma-70 family RNA polymerase sigma factor [Leucobacter insecticola]QIM15829.1 sigma-70 family RNA polymerase sigma factor [Leucobacter insecticola]